MKEWFKARNVWGAAIQTLSDAEAGRLMKALWAYTMTGEEPNLSGAEKGIMALIMLTLSQDEEQTAEVSRKRAIAGAIGGRQRVSNVVEALKSQANQANASDASLDQANQANASNKNKNKSKNKNTESETETEELFERFWSAYPRKVGKPDAKKKFQALKPDDALVEKMIASINSWKPTDQWQDERFIPHPATWLHQRRWEDEPPKSSKSYKPGTAQGYQQRSYADMEDDAMERMFD